MIKNYYYLLVGVLVILSAVTHAWNGQLVTLPMLDADFLDIHARTIFFYVWHIITAENLIFGVAFLLMAFYRDLSKVRFAAWMTGIIMIARWLVIFGSTLYKNKTDILEILTDSIAITIVVALIILGVRVKNKPLADHGRVIKSDGLDEFFNNTEK